MPAYVIADVREVRDQDALVEYRRRNTDAVANHGGRFVVRGGEAELLEGSWDTLRMVVIEFPDIASARAWWESEEYAPLKQLRRDASDTNIILVDGADRPTEAGVRRCGEGGTSGGHTARDRP